MTLWKLLTFGGNPVSDRDFGSLFHFRHHCGIVDFWRLAYLIVTCWFLRYVTKRPALTREWIQYILGAIWQTSISIWIRINPDIWIVIPDQILALAEFVRSERTCVWYFLVQFNEDMTYWVATVLRHAAFTTCVSGYRGYTCEDDTEAASEAMQKLYTALLTSSNLGFIPAIVLACWRWYFVEAVAYLANMTFSLVSFSLELRFSIYTRTHTRRFGGHLVGWNRVSRMPPP